MSYRRYEYTNPIPYGSGTKTIRRETTTTTTERAYGTPDYKYSYETTSSRTSPRPSYYPDYRSVLTTSGYGYTPKWYDTNVTRTTTNVGPYGVSTRTYRY